MRSTMMPLDDRNDAKQGQPGHAASVDGRQFILRPQIYSISISGNQACKYDTPLQDHAQVLTQSSPGGALFDRSGGTTSAC